MADTLLQKCPVLQYIEWNGVEAHCYELCFYSIQKFVLAMSLQGLLL